MIRASFIAGVFLTALTTAAVLDTEPPVFTFCPSDILIDDAVETEIRVNWKRPLATDNSGVVPTVVSNLPSGDIFAVPGVYEIVYTAEDGSGNRATCRFTITLKIKTCPLFAPPQNGALACMKFGSDRVCAVMCESDFDFSAAPPLLYLCAGGEWTHISILPGTSTDTPLDCNVSYHPGLPRKMNIFPYYYYNDPQNVQDNFKSLIDLFGLANCNSDPSACATDKIEVYLH